MFYQMPRVQLMAPGFLMEAEALNQLQFQVMVLAWRLSVRGEIAQEPLIPVAFV